jgi:hypothetical protein
MRKGAPAPALYGGNQCRLRLHGGLEAMPSADTNSLSMAVWRHNQILDRALSTFPLHRQL